MVILIFTVAFSQNATGPSSVCEGSDVTLQCRIVFNNNLNATLPSNSNWQRNGMTIDGLLNHVEIIDPGTGLPTNLMITNVTLEDDNSVYTCASNDDNITSSVVLNVSGMYINSMYIIYVYVCMVWCIKN